MGTLPDIIDQAARFLKLYIRVGAEIVEFKRIDMPEYPLEALREAVVNAVVHRDYSLEGETVRIFFYTDRVEVHSPGLLPPGVTLADLVQMRAPSRPRNVLLAQFMRDLPGYMERVGAGIRFMVNEMRNLELPDPDFREHHEFLVIFRNGELVSPEVASTLSPHQLIGLQLIQEREASRVASIVRRPVHRSGRPSANCVLSQTGELSWYAGAPVVHVITSHNR